MGLITITCGTFWLLASVVTSADGIQRLELNRSSSYEILLDRRLGSAAGVGRKLTDVVNVSDGFNVSGAFNASDAFNSSTAVNGTTAANSTTAINGTTAVNGTAEVNGTAAVNRTRSPNLLIIVTDQHRFDALGFIQARSPAYSQSLHIRTPNIDALAKRAVYFKNAYCVSPSCGPSRASIKTGTTVQRTGVLNNLCFKDAIIRRMSMIKEKIDRMVSFEQLLVEEKRYVAESYGKWHTPFRLYYEGDNPNKRVINYDVYNAQGQPSFQKYMQVQQFYQPAVKQTMQQDGYEPHYTSTSQENYFSHLPYNPIRLDPRYGYPAKTPLTKKAGFDGWQLSFDNICGVQNDPSKYSATSVTGKFAVQALKRLAANKNQPFVLSVHFNAPHPPVVASPEYFPYYNDSRGQLFVSPSINDKMANSAYSDANQRKLIPKLGRRYPYSDRTKIAELTAAYYAMIEEVDDWVGKLVDVLDRNNIRSDTMIVFTADHGEMMGSHAMLGKAILLEEAVRVPLVISFPGTEVSGTIIDPVSQLDLHATVLDYLGARRLDNSDGTSLRRFTEQLSYNEEYDERVVVVELDQRYPIDNSHFQKNLGDYPNFMVRKGSYKLILTKLAMSRVMDMMYNLETDPYEMNNLLGKNGNRASLEAIGKAEHLRALLLEWMIRMDGPYRLYSDPKYNLNVGSGDIDEIQKRRTWRNVDYWQSDSTLTFGPPALINGTYVRYEYLYVGRTLQTNTPLSLSNIHVAGKDAKLFSIFKKEATITTTGYVRIQVALRSREPIDPMKVNAWVEFTTYKGVRVIPIILE